MTAPRRSRVTVVALAVLAALALGGIVAIPLGGWDEVELATAAPPQLAVGDTYQGRRFEVTVESLDLAATHPDGDTAAEPGERFLVLTATVVNRWTGPQGGSVVASSLFELSRDVPATAESADVTLTSDGTRPIWLGPDVPTRIFATWVVPDDAVAPRSTVRVGIIDGRPDLNAELVADVVWRDLQIAVDVPVLVEVAP